MKKEKTIGGIVAFVVMTILALPFVADIPLISAYVFMMIFINTIFAFGSIFLQRLVIVLYEANVFEKPSSAIGYAFKYFAMYSSGINYYVQTICNRLPFVLNKIMAIIFFVYLAFSTMAILFIFEG